MSWVDLIHLLKLQILWTIMVFWLLYWLLVTFLFFLFTLSISAFNLVELLALKWVYYNFKISKSSELANLLTSKNSGMICFAVYFTLRQNPFLDRQNELTKTKSKNNCLTFGLAQSRAPTDAWVNIIVVRNFKTTSNTLSKLSYRLNLFQLYCCCSGSFLR